MRGAIGVSAALLLLADVAAAQWRTTSSRSIKPPGKCEIATCALPVSAIVSGGLSGAYLGAWAYRQGELPVGLHVGGALFGGMSMVTSVLYMTTNDPEPRYRTFGAIATMAVGAPALVLGLHGLITAESASDDKGPPPAWYGPSVLAVSDVRGRAAHGLALVGMF
jgi:hypothetical protein